MLNLYGDRLFRNSPGHGSDIAAQRLDELDAAALQAVLQKRLPDGVAIDLGCGSGYQGLRLAALGCPTWLIDTLPVERTVLRVAGLGDLLPLHYLCRDARFLNENDLPKSIALVSSQRFIHYLPHADAVMLLSRLRRRMTTGALLFLSASGLVSELANGYTAATQPLRYRFAGLAPEMAEKHGIDVPVCLYSGDDLKQLARVTGFDVQSVRISPFGNIKGIFTVT